MMNDQDLAVVPLKEQWEEYLKEHPKTRIRDAATALGVSEAELLATKCGYGVTRLKGDWRELFPEFEALGKMMSLTRNQYIVHETTGVYKDTSFERHVGMVLGEGIDLRLFMHSWGDAFAVEEESLQGTRFSIQFFDRSGTAVHKVYLRNAAAEETFRNLVERWKSENQSPEQQTEPVQEKKAETPDAEINAEGLQADWSSMTNTHEFFGLLGKYGVTRTQALRLAGDEHAWRVNPRGAYQYVLQQAVESETPIMIFVGNHGCIQIFTGKLQRLVATDGWFNVLDPDFNLHIREEGVAEAWVVRKPTSDGIVTSLELYDANGENLALVFGSRKESIVENLAWRTIIDSLPAMYKYNDNETM